MTAGGKIACQVDRDSRLTGPTLGVQDDYALHGGLWISRARDALRSQAYAGIRTRASRSMIREHAHAAVIGLTVSYPPMEEMFLHTWDELDDLLHLCRHVATSAATETLAATAPFVAGITGAILAGCTLALQHLRELTA